MKRISLFSVLCVLLHGAAIAQFSYARDKKPAGVINVKYTSRTETMNTARELGGMSSEQTEKLYLVNLDLTRKYFYHQDASFDFDRNSVAYQQYQKEKLEKYKAILTKEQYQRYLEVESRKEINLVSHDLKGYEKHDSTLAPVSRISSTR